MSVSSPGGVREEDRGLPGFCLVLPLHSDSLRCLTKLWTSSTLRISMMSDHMSGRGRRHAIFDGEAVRTPVSAERPSRHAGDGSFVIEPVFASPRERINFWIVKTPIAIGV